MHMSFVYSDGAMYIGGSEKRRIAADSIVRNESNGERALHDPSQVVYAMTHDPYTRYPVMPRPFPVGYWQVYMPRRRSDRYLAPFFIPTDAERELSVWALDARGGYDHETETKVLDLGYGLHYSASRTTFGCIRVAERKDLLWLVDRISAILGSGESVVLRVEA